MGERPRLTLTLTLTLTTLTLTLTLTLILSLTLSRTLSLSLTLTRREQSLQRGRAGGVVSTMGGGEVPHASQAELGISQVELWLG